MAWVCEIACRGDPALADALSQWFAAGSAQSLRQLPGLSALDLYRLLEAGARDPFNDDPDGPSLMIMCEFASRDALAAASAEVEQALSRPPVGVEVTVTGLERRLYPVAEQAVPAPLHARFSYVVRYHRPAEDEAAFVANYVATHPATLAKLPRIRSVICYFPIDAPARGRHRAADYMIGNEVVFDTVADFNAAMQSPVRQELRAHYRAFPKFTGRNTHYPMLRTRIMG